MKVFAKKATALKYVKPNQIICNVDIKKYFLLSSYQEFAETIQKHTCPNFYEFIPENSFVNFFLDIEIHSETQQEYFNKCDEIMSEILNTLKLVFPQAQKTIVLQSHSKTKKSFHVIVRCDTFFYGVKNIKPLVIKLFPDLVNLKIVDTSVYREGLFRTYLSTKTGENRPLVVCDLSDPFDMLDTFVCYCPNASKENLLVPVVDLVVDKVMEPEPEPEVEIIQPIQKELTAKDQEHIRHFVRREYNYREGDLREIFIDQSLNCIIIALLDKFCHNVDREHKSNFQYIVIDTFSCKKKCHDSDCANYKYNEIKFDKLPKEINEIILKCLKVNKHELELIEKAIEDCRSYINTNFDENIQEIQFDKNQMVFKGDASDLNGLALKGQCVQCRLEHQITTTGYCLKCSVCNIMFPRNQMIPVDDRYKNLNTFWMNYNQLVNNGTVNININNYYNNSEEEFSCDVQLDNGIFRNKELTKMYNQILDGHKVIMISELVSKLEKDFKYTKGHWFYFNGSIWKKDEDNIELKKRILTASGNFLRIQHFYENKRENGSTQIVKNVKSLVNKIYKPGFQDEIIKGTKLYYVDEELFAKLNSKKHLIPFTNGVYDLLSNSYRKTTKEDYVNLTVGFDYDPKADNPETIKFIEQILPNKGVRDYVLKKMSECLNGDIPNTNFLMFIGNGANGKSQLLNLMKLVMGELGEKVEVTLLTRKRNNANEANTEKIKLMNKRFAFLSEPEDGEKINIGLLKELTGSEEIVARGLYQDSVSFVMEAKLFLACNELPDIKGEDTALWRRIRVVDFPSRFVDDPKEDNEFTIDRTLPSRMREDISWRQTFMNLLISYYYKHVQEPFEVQVKTNEYRQENNDFYNWLDENIELKAGKALALRDVCSLFFQGKTKVGVKEKGKFRRELEKSIKVKFPTVDHNCSRTTYNGDPFQGWMGLCLKDI